MTIYINIYIYISNIHWIGSREILTGNWLVFTIKYRSKVQKKPVNCP